VYSGDGLTDCHHTRKRPRSRHGDGLTDYHHARKRPRSSPSPPPPHQENRHFRRWRNVRVPFVLAAILCSAALAEPVDSWQFAPEDAKVFLGFRWSNIAASEIGRMLRKKIADAGFTTMPAFGLLNEIDEVVIASPGKQPDDPEDKQPRVLIRVSGRFHAGEFERLMAEQGTRVQSYRTKKVYRRQKDGNMAFTLLDEHSFLVGDAPSVFSALDRLQWPGPAANPLVERARRLRDAYDLWALFTVAPSAMAGRVMPDLPLIGDVSGLEMGVSFQSGLDLRLGLDTGSPESAATLAAELKKTLKLALKDAQKSPDLGAAAKKLQIAADDASVRMTLRISPAEFERSLAEIQRRPHHAQPAVAESVPPGQPMTPAQPAPPPARQMIRIEGLDGGPKEVPLAR